MEKAVRIRIQRTNCQKAKGIPKMMVITNLGDSYAAGTESIQNRWRRKGSEEGGKIRIN